jgi:DNA-binding transcriptional regulator PaaX
MPCALWDLRIFQKLHLRKKLNYQQRTYKVARTFYYLKKRGYIRTVFEKNKWKVIVTRKGRDKIRGLRYEILSIPKSESWDGKFWQVAADIPTKYRSGADAFRIKIKKLGLFPLQRTLWFYPYDLREEIGFISRFYKIESFVTVMRVDKLDPADKKVIRGHFREAELI